MIHEKARFGTLPQGRPPGTVMAPGASIALDRAFSPNHDQGKYPDGVELRGIERDDGKVDVFWDHGPPDVRRPMILPDVSTWSQLLEVAIPGTRKTVSVP